jgi:type I restriction enzyme, S subunit
MSWRDCTLGDVLKLQRGHDLPDRARIDGPVPVVSSSGITGRHNVAKAEPPGVVTGRYGTIGEVFYIEEPYWPLNTALYVVDFKGCDPRFAAYLLRTTLKNYQSEKAAVPGVDRNVLHMLKVRAPGVAAQGRIVSVLAAYDDLIQNNGRRIALLGESARLLYREWFVHLRFPGHEHVKVVDGVPVGWERATLREACLSIEDGDWIETKDQGGSDYRLLQISNVGVNEFVETGNYRFITEETYSRLNCRELLPGCILIARMPKPIGRAWLVHEMPWRMITAVDVAIAVTDPEVADPYFLTYFINSPANLALCERRAVGATRQRITRRDVAGLPLTLPPLRLQEQFRDVVELLNRQRQLLQRQCERLSEARDLLLPRLMSGAITV